MKRILLIALLCLLAGCAGSMRHASRASEKIYIGMSLSKFNRVTHGKATLEAMNAKRTVYRFNLVSRDEVQYFLGNRRNYTVDAKFFYFDSRNKLYKIDDGGLRGIFIWDDIEFDNIGFNNRNDDKGRNRNSDHDRGGRSRHGRHRR